MRARDSQRQKLYDAEWLIIKDYEKCGTVIGAQDYVNKILRSAWWKRRSPVGRVDVKFIAGRRFAATAYKYMHYGSSDHIGEIKIRNKSGYYKMVLLHELTHILIWDLCNRTNQASHGPLFAKYYAEIVKRFLGIDAARTLKSKFDEGKVKYRCGISLEVLKEVPAARKKSGKYVNSKKPVNTKQIRISGKLRDATNTISVFYNISQSKLIQQVEDKRINAAYIYDWMKKLGYVYRKIGYFKEWSKDNPTNKKYEEHFLKVLDNIKAIK